MDIALDRLVNYRQKRSENEKYLFRLQDNERQGRSDTPQKRAEQEQLKNSITTVVGAALGEQECWERTACKVGEYTSALPGKDVLFILMDRVAPSSWLDSLNIVRDVRILLQH